MVNTYILAPETWNITLHGKRVGVTLCCKRCLLKSLRWGERSGLSRWTLCAITGVLMRGRGRLETPTEKWSFANRGRDWSNEAASPGCLELLGTGWGRQDPPLGPGREHSPDDIWMLDFGPPGCEAINFYCLKLPGLWCFAASALNANVVPDVHQHGDSQVHIFLSCLCFIRIVAKSRTFCPWSSMQVIKMNNISMCA